MSHIQSALQEAASQLQSVSDSPRLDAECLLAFVLGCTRAHLYAFPEQVLSLPEQRQWASLTARRLSGEPVAYLLGEQEFYGLPFKVTSDVLIPRPETETMVDWVLNHFDESARSLLDLGTGSGAIAIAVAKARPQWRVSAIDCSDSALAIAAHNAKQNEVDHVRFLKSDWFDQVKDDDFDIIVSNPPYISQHDAHLSALVYEPTSALVSEQNGLLDIHSILQQARNYLRSSGVVVIEHGYDQGAQVVQLAHNCGWARVQCYQDLSGHDRFIVAEF